jgi:hypothetical protein
MNTSTSSFSSNAASVSDTEVTVVTPHSTPKTKRTPAQQAMAVGFAQMFGTYYAMMVSITIAHYVGVKRQTSV